MVKCNKCFKKRACYGHEYKKPLRCNVCREDKMFNVITKMCEECKKVQPVYGLVKGKATHCATCKTEEMFNVISKMCEECKKVRPAFGLEKGKATHCATCKTEEMFNVKDKMCEECEKVQPFYGLVKGKATHCATCKTEEMFNVKSKMCLSTWCDTIAKSLLYKGYCYHCYVNLFPDDPISKSYKRKETEVINYLKKELPNKSLVFDKKIDHGCSRRRPDVFLDLYSHVIICEIDENQHGGYAEICENRRIMELSVDLAHRPIVFLRFNPDGYVRNKIRVANPWKRTKTGVSLQGKYKEQWNERLYELCGRFKYWMENVPEKSVTTEHLYFTEGQ